MKERTLALVLALLTLAPSLRAAADGAELHASLERDPRIPAYGRVHTSDTQWIVRDDVVDLAEVTDTRAWRRQAPGVTYVFADVLRIPDGFVQILDQQALVVFARRVEVEGDAITYLDYRRGKDALMSFYAAEWDGAIDVVGYDPDAGQEDLLRLGGQDALELLVAHDGESTALMEADDIPRSYFQYSPDLPLSLERALLLASTLGDESLDERLALLDWVLRVARHAPNLTLDSTFGALAADSAAQLAFFQAHAGGNFVPELSRDVYLDVGEAYLDALESYQAQYDRFVDRSLATSERVAAARSVLDEAQLGVESKQAFLDQALQDADSAAVTAREAELRFQRQEEQVALARVSFEVGIERWKRETTIAAVVGAVEALLKVVASVAATGNPATSLKAIAEVSKSTAEAIAALQKIITSVRDLQRGGAKLQIAVEHGDVESLALSAEALAQVEGQFLFADEAWKRFAVESRALLQFAVKEGVRGSTDYQIELESLALAGQTWIAAQRMEVSARQTVTQTALAVGYATRNRQRIEALIDDLENGQQDSEALAASMARRMVELKRPIYLALLKYAAAYRYWALLDIEVPISLLDDPGVFRASLARIRRAYEAALTRFPQAPQVFQGKSLTIRDESLLRGFRESGVLSLSVGLNEPAFRGLDRVRLDGVRVWFEGAKCPQQCDSRACAKRQCKGVSCPTQVCFAYLRTSGSYEDRLSSQAFAFSGPSLLRIFQYETDPSGAARVLVDGRLSDEFEFAYFEPTPFTGWTVVLSDDLNPGLDRSKVTGVRMEWSGSAIGSVTQP